MMLTAEHKILRNTKILKNGRYRPMKYVKASALKLGDEVLTINGLRRVCRPFSAQAKEREDGNESSAI
jgi:hypothetical protein